MGNWIDVPDMTGDNCLDVEYLYQVPSDHYCRNGVDCRSFGNSMLRCRADVNAGCCCT